MTARRFSPGKGAAMATLEIHFPCSAREIELRLHTFCDHHGAWESDCEIAELENGVMAMVVKHKEVKK